ncbi:MAG: FAD-binding oxidoreductase, partial [Desulfobacterales bacterium]|nr:FAD-binding oxidoreductase [Desulfobacterales bacterium]
GSEGVVQIDLRRMNKIIEIDEKNMFAVVEPYVCCSQLHSEVMKKGLNCHIIGAGPNTSPLASTTSGWGNGWTGLATAYGARNPLALEWVLPNGDLLKLGSIGSDSGWISGDGPGPGLRGIMRGMMGAQGGLGVFTKCAIKLFPWNGPEKVDVEGLVLDLKAEIPKTEKIYFLFSKDHDAFADLAYEIGNAEIGYLHCKGAFGMFKVGSPKIMNKILETKLMREMLKAFKVCTFFAISASSERELEYEEKVIRKIVAENNGALLDLSKLKFIHGGLWWGLHRSIQPALAFRPGGDFLTSMGSCVAYDNAVLQVKVGEKIKQEYIDKGAFFEDLADCTWGGIYEGTSNWGHLEEVGMYNRRDQKSQDARFEYLEVVNQKTFEHKLGLGLSALAPGMYNTYGPKMFNYHIWQMKIKQALDPQHASDSSFYVPPLDEYEEGME